MQLPVYKIYNKRTTVDGNFLSSFIYKWSGPKFVVTQLFKSGHRCEAVNVDFPFPSYKTMVPLGTSIRLPWRNLSALKKILPPKIFRAFLILKGIYQPLCLIKVNSVLLIIWYSTSPYKNIFPPEKDDVYGMIRKTKFYYMDSIVVLRWSKIFESAWIF